MLPTSNDGEGGGNKAATPVAIVAGERGPHPTTKSTTPKRLASSTATDIERNNKKKRRRLRNARKIGEEFTDQHWKGFIDKPSLDDLKNEALIRGLRTKDLKNKKAFFKDWLRDNPHSYDVRPSFAQGSDNTTTDDSDDSDDSDDNSDHDNPSGVAWLGYGNGEESSSSSSSSSASSTASALRKGLDAAGTEAAKARNDSVARAAMKSTEVSSVAGDSATQSKKARNSGSEELRDKARASAARALEVDRKHNWNQSGVARIGHCVVHFRHRASELYQKTSRADLDVKHPRARIFDELAELFNSPSFTPPNEYKDVQGLGSLVPQSSEKTITAEEFDDKWAKVRTIIQKGIKNIQISGKGTDGAYGKHNVADFAEDLVPGGEDDESLTSGVDSNRSRSPADFDWGTKGSNISRGAPHHNWGLQQIKACLEFLSIKATDEVIEEYITKAWTAVDDVDDDDDCDIDAVVDYHQVVVDLISSNLCTSVSTYRSTLETAVESTNFFKGMTGAAYCYELWRKYQVMDQCLVELPSPFNGSSASNTAQTPTGAQHFVPVKPQSNKANMAKMLQGFGDKLSESFSAKESASQLQLNSAFQRAQEEKYCNTLIASIGALQDQVDAAPEGPKKVMIQKWLDAKTKEANKIMGCGGEEVGGGESASGGTTDI